MLSICGNCRQPFEHVTGRKYCSPQCSEAVYKQQHVLNHQRRLRGEKAQAACLVCKKLFDQRGPQTYCSPECHYVAVLAKNRQRAKETRAKQTEAQLGSMVCFQCGTRLERKSLHGRGERRFCSPKCNDVFELREYHRKRAERGLPKIGDTVACDRCGEATTRRNPSGPFYCVNCKPIVRAEIVAAYRERNRDELRQRDRARSQHPMHNLNQRMRRMLLEALKRQKGRRSWRTFVDYSLEELARHLERQFIKGMTWENIGRWHIDHIIPKSAFAYTSPDDPDFKACWALTNLRPLWKRDNLVKSAKRTHLL